MMPLRCEPIADVVNICMSKFVMLDITQYEFLY